MEKDLFASFVGFQETIFPLEARNDSMFFCRIFQHFLFGSQPSSFFFGLQQDDTLGVFFLGTTIRDNLEFDQIAFE